jgi:hypothetical protein
MTKNLLQWIASCVRKIGVAFAVSSVFAYGTMLARLNAYERACDEFSRSNVYLPDWGARSTDAGHSFSTGRSGVSTSVNAHTTLAILPSASSTFDRPLNALSRM